MHSSRFSIIASEVLGVALPMFDIIKEASSVIPVPMVQPLIGVVAGFLKAADVSSAMILFSGVLMPPLSKPVIISNG